MDTAINEITDQLSVSAGHAAVTKADAWIEAQRWPRASALPRGPAHQVRL
jgi:hypothetical protein